MVGGELLIIGGAESKEGDCSILRQFMDGAAQRNGKILILPTASKDPEGVGKEYFRIFKDLKSLDIEVLTIQNRQDAHNQIYAQEVATAAAIFFTGGDQLRITSILGGTPINRALHLAFQRGALIAGTSAGAAIMSDTMIVEGEDDESPRRCTVKMAPGLGLLRQVVVDMHFSQRGRQGRLLTAIGQNPDIIGIGIDEDTAIWVTGNQKFVVLGSRTIWIVDGREISESNVSELEPDEVLVLADVRLHILPQGYGFDMEKRQVTSEMMEGGMEE